MGTRWGKETRSGHGGRGMNQRRVALGSRSAGSCVRGRIAIHACRFCVIRSTSLCHTHIHVWKYVNIYVCVYIYVKRAKEGEREREKCLLLLCDVRYMRLLCTHIYLGMYEYICVHDSTCVCHVHIYM